MNGTKPSPGKDKVLSKLGLCLDKMNSVFLYSMSALMLFLIFFVNLNVFARYSGHPLIGAEEISEYILFMITFLPAAWLLSKEKHVIIDLGLRMVGGKKQQMMNFVSSLVALIYCIVLFFLSGLWVYQSFSRGARFDTVLGFPMWPITVFMPIGFFFLVLQFIRRAHHYWSLTGKENL